MGRRKIEIQPLSDDRNRTVTFVKRKAGLFKKAHELAVLCQVDLAVIIVGNNNKVYEFSSVDTNELLNMYRGVKPHESKSPANYGNYKKKRHLNQVLFPIDDEISIEDENESEYDSDTPEPKRQKKQDDGDLRRRSSNRERRYSSRRPTPPSHISLSTVPTFNMGFGSGNVTKQVREEVDDRATIHRGPSSHTRDNSTASNVSATQRPVLRVQIPIDPKNTENNDSAKTITAIETNNQNGTATSNSKTSNGKASSTNAHGHVNAPNINPKYQNFGTFKSPDNAKPITTLPLPIQSKSQTSSPSSATAPSLPMSGMSSFFGSLPQPSPSVQYTNNAILPTPILNQVLNQQYSSHQHQQHQQNNTTSNGNENLNQNQPGTGTKQRLLLSGAQYTNNQGGEQSPVSGLPSRYINELFPSPSNFYVPQDWSNAGTGMTPIHSSMPQYFMNMIPSSGGPLSARAQLQAQSQGQMKSENLISPLQFMGLINSSNAASQYNNNAPADAKNAPK